MSPKQIHATLLPEVKEAVLVLTAGYPIAKIGEELEKFSNYFQGLAIAHLLRGADLDQFRLYLTRSGYARRYFLRRSADEGNADDPHLALGRTEAFLDAVAAGQMNLAREIARFSGTVWHSDCEYEDDFCYYLFLHKVAADLNPAVDELREILIRFEAALEGGKSFRLNLCRAIMARDSESFRASLFALMSQRRDEMLALRDLMSQVEPRSCVCWARSFVSIEGLALMRLGEMAGIPTLEPDAEPPLCPPLGRVETADTPYEDFFEGIGRELERGR